MRLEDVLLYFIADMDRLPSGSASAFCRAAIGGGADLIHLRGGDVNDPSSVDVAAVASVCRGDDALLVIEDAPQTVVAIDADGVHLGSVDASISLMRAVVGVDKLVGLSARTPDEVALALEVEADYVLHFAGRGCIGAFAGLLGIATVPLFAAGLGGLEEASELVEQGVLRLCIDAASLDGTRIEEEVAEYSRLLGRCI